MHRIFRNRDVVDGDAREHGSLSHLCRRSHPGILQITSLSHILRTAHEAVAGRKAFLLHVRTDTAVPVKEFIIPNLLRRQFPELPGGAEMDKLRRGKADHLHGKTLKRLPDLFPACQKLLAQAPLRRLLIKLLQGGSACERIKEIPVKADPRLFIHKTAVFYLIQLSLAADQGQQRIQKIAVKQNGSRIQIHISLCADRSQPGKLLLGLFM